MAVALGYGLYALADDLAYIFVDALGQSVGADTDLAAGGVNELLESFAVPGPNRLVFSVGGTVFIYGVALVQALALLLVGLTSYGLWRLRLRRLQECPHCVSRIPRAATVCRECSLEVAT